MTSEDKRYLPLTLKYFYLLSSTGVGHDSINLGITSHRINVLLFVIIIAWLVKSQQEETTLCPLRLLPVKVHF